MGENLAKYDIHALAEKPRNNVEMVAPDAVVFSSLQAVTSPKTALLLHDQVFELSVDYQKSTIVELPEHLFQMLGMVYPKPELLVVGLGKQSRMLGPKTREQFQNLGIRIEASTTRNAALSYDLLATERSPQLVAALLMPPNL